MKRSEKKPLLPFRFLSYKKHKHKHRSGLGTSLQSHRSLTETGLKVLVKRSSASSELRTHRHTFRLLAFARSKVLLLCITGRVDMEECVEGFLALSVELKSMTCRSCRIAKSSFATMLRKLPCIHQFEQHISQHSHHLTCGTQSDLLKIISWRLAHDSAMNRLHIRLVHFSAACVVRILTPPSGGAMASTVSGSEPRLLGVHSRGFDLGQSAKSSERRLVAARHTENVSGKALRFVLRF